MKRSSYFGLSTNKTVAKVATNESKPNGEGKVEAGLEKPFLAPLSVNKIPYIGTQTGNLLKQMGVNSSEQFRRCHQKLFSNCLEKWIGIMETRQRY